MRQIIAVSINDKLPDDTVKFYVLAGCPADKIWLIARDLMFECYGHHIVDGWCELKKVE